MLDHMDHSDSRSSPLYSKILQFPSSPGVYLMKNAEGEILYVGKAKNLKPRVLSYFSAEKEGRYQVRFLMKKVSDIEPILTANEKEALLLENTLIKKHKPRYNIILKDDKTYISIKLNIQHPFPRLVPTRRIVKDGSLYFGPYPSGFEAKGVVDFIEQHFRLRTCSDKEFANRARPCLQHQIKRCDAPCVGLISKSDYQDLVQQIKLFLQGKNQELIDSLKDKMEKASEALEFEKAAELRNLVSAIERTLEKQKVVKPFAADQDIIGFHREGERVSLVVLISRMGVLSEKRHYPFKTSQDSGEILESFLVQYYEDRNRIPKEVLLPLPLEGIETLEEILSERKEQKVFLRTPERGESSAKVKLANQNAEERLKQAQANEEGREEILKQIQERLELKKFPRRIECYDISNIQGETAVGSMVCFIDGKPAKNFYRRLKIKTVHQANDFAMHYETLRRRLSHPEWPLPDLIVIDGGKGQLSSAQAALHDGGILEIDLVALAKERNASHSTLESPNPSESLDPKEPSEKTTKKPERIFLLNRKDPVIFPQHSSALHLLMHLRDEAHRFGITYHRKLRNQRTLLSPLDSIPGIATVRKRNLLKAFGSLKKIKEASLKELAQTKGMNEELAQRVYQALRTS